MSLRIRILTLIICVLAALSQAWAAGVNIELSMPRGQREIAVGSLFYIVINVDGSNAEPAKPSSVGGAKVMYFQHTGSSSSFVSVNGKTTQSFSNSYTLTLKATEAGSYSFGPVNVGGMKSNTVNYKIVAVGSNSSNDDRNRQGNQSAAAQSGNDDGKDAPKYIGNGDGNLFMRANISRTTAYEQEALVYTVKLYSTYDAIKFIGATATPKFEGFVVEESKDISTQLNVETYNGRSYATAIIARYIIFPQMPGTLKVLGNTYTVSVDKREYYRDPFWGSMSYGTPLQLNVKPNDMQINVKALPAPKPADFSGGVGSFSIQSSLPQAQYKTNQAASIKYTVKGSGNLKYINLPDLNAVYPAQLEVYSPTTDVKANVGSNDVSGTVTFDYSFIPLEEGEFRIPDVKLVYFNPATEKYESSVAKGYNITVGKGTASSKSQTGGKLKFDSDLMPASDKTSDNHNPVIYGFAYWLWYIIPVVLLISAILGWRRYASLHSDMAAFNSRRADKFARRRLKKAYQCMQRNDADKFYDELLYALWGYLGDKLKMPTSMLMRDNIRQVLTERGVDDSVISKFITLIDDCEFAKYSPQKSQENMNILYDEAIKSINDLEKSFKKN